MPNKKSKLGRKPYKMIGEAYNNWTSIGLFEEKGKKAYWLELKNQHEDLQIEINCKQQMSIMAYDLKRLADHMIRLSTEMEGIKNEQ
jgi:hypothetical protein